MAISHIGMSLGAKIENSSYLRSIAHKTKFVNKGKGWMGTCKRFMGEFVVEISRKREGLTIRIQGNPS